MVQGASTQCYVETLSLLWHGWLPNAAERATRFITGMSKVRRYDRRSC